ncbi:MAG: type II toxin-antitoxin system HicB family antitoxin [Fluviibacter sp.]|jgi:antitoxin HicB
MKMEIRYQAIFEPQEEGGFTVTFPDIPEAITEGKSREEAAFNAIEVLGRKIGAR